MFNDPTETTRRQWAAEINTVAQSMPQDAFYQTLVETYGAANVWTTNELAKKFEVLGFMAPFCVVRDRATGKKGSVEFSHFPRYYFEFRSE